MRRIVAAVLTVLVASGVAASVSSAQDAGDQPIDPQWLSNTLQRASTATSVQNNTPSEAIQRRDQAIADWKAANAKFAAGQGPRPSAFAKPEYSVVWSSKQNVADVHSKVISDFINNATVNPQGLVDLLNPQFAPGLDGFQVIDTRKLNVDGSENPDYGKVVNFVQLPLPWGVETEAHHMQYQWDDGDPIVAGGLFNDTTFVLDPKDIPNLELKNIIAPQDTLQGTIPDAYDSVGDGRFIGTYMGGPEANFGGSPGDVSVFKPDPQKGLVLESETPAGSIGGADGAGNANGVPEPCSAREAEPLGTCANPHGIQIRQDLKRMVTADYAEPREIVLDPVKTKDKYVFRPTVRVWDTSNPGAPKLVSVAHMPENPREPANRSHENIGIMEDAKTWPSNPNFPTLPSNGMFAGSMCGGGIFFTPDITKLNGDSSKQWIQVWDDGISNQLTGEGKFLDEPGGCAGGAWHQVSPNNKWLYRSVQGRAPNADNYFDQGAVKMIYDIDIRPLIESAKDGHIDCNLSQGVDLDHDGKIDLTGIQVFQKLSRGETVADCPRAGHELVVNDVTSGGPHWGALDNHSLAADGTPKRLVFSDYFVARTGIDGDHRFYVVDINPKTGQLSYDDAFRDEDTGALGVNFNRRNWPGSPDAGFYKPHSMLWVCPPGICPRDDGGYDEAGAPSTAGGGADGLALKVVSVKQVRGGLRVGVSANQAARGVQVVVRDRRKHVLGKSGASAIGRGGKRTFSVRLRHAVRRGSYSVAATGKAAKGGAVANTLRSVRLR